MKRRLLVATRNPGKVAEFAEMLADLDVDWLSLDDAGVVIDVEETGNSFLANAVLKAQVYAEISGMLTLADDSGLEVDALAGAPGIYTARYGGPGLTPAQRYEYLLHNMRDVVDRLGNVVCGLLSECLLHTVGEDAQVMGNLVRCGRKPGAVRPAPRRRSADRPREKHAARWPAPSTHALS